MRIETKNRSVFLAVHLFFQMFVIVSALWPLACVGGNWVFWVLAGLFFVLYFFVQNGAFLFFAEWVLRRTENVFLSRVIFLACSYTLFIWWLTRGSLVIFGRFEGVPFFQPLLFLLNFKFIRLMIVLLGEWGTFFLLTFLSSYFLLGATVRWRRNSFFVMASFLLFFQVISETSVTFPGWISKVVLVPVVFDRSLSPGDQAEALCSVLASSIRAHPRGEYFCFPESAFSFPFDPTSSTGRALTSLSWGRVLVFGAYRREGGVVYNALFAVRDGEIFFYRDKTHGMPCVERLPRFFEHGMVARGLSTICPEGFFSQSAVLPSCFAMGEDATVVPLICSEFFWNIPLVGITSSTVILVVVHDAWFSGTILPWLMWRAAWLKSLLLHRSIIYVGYLYQGAFDAGGRWSHLL